MTVTSWPEGEVEDLTAPYFPADVGKPGERTLPFGRELWIDRDDFALDPPAGYQRLAPGRTVRLRHGYCITCDEVVEDATARWSSCGSTTCPARSASTPAGRRRCRA